MGCGCCICSVVGESVIINRQKPEKFHIMDAKNNEESSFGTCNLFSEENDDKFSNVVEVTLCGLCDQKYSFSVAVAEDEFVSENQEKKTLFATHIWHGEHEFECQMISN